LSPEAPVQEPAGTPSPAAPIEAAQDTAVTTIERGNVVSHEFRNPDSAPKSETQTPATESATAEATAATEAAAPEGERTAADDISDDELKRLEKSAKLQARIEQLANNKAGNLAQRDRERIRAEERQRFQEESAAWEKADEGYQLLVSKGRDSFKERYGMTEPQAAAWEANYLAEREKRDAAPQVQATQSDEQIRSDFNSGAIAEFQAGIKTLLPFYGDLPEETRKTIESARFDPEGNWLADSLEALAAGVAARDERVAREHKAALAEARTAGANSALADREEASPVIIDPKPNNLAAMSNAELNMAYAENVIDRTTYNAEKRRRGIDY